MASPVGCLVCMYLSTMCFLWYVNSYRTRQSAKFLEQIFVKFCHFFELQLHRTVLKHAFTPPLPCIKYRKSKLSALLCSLVLIQQFKMSLFQTGLKVVWLKSRLWGNKWHDTKQILKLTVYLFSILDPICVLLSRLSRIRLIFFFFFSCKDIL